MTVQNVLHMNSGDGETSYANNSSHQKKVILTVQLILEETLKKVHAHFQGEDCLRIADLGSSSGPNTFLVISKIVQTLQALSNQSQYCEPCELQIYLNDLPENDFNSIFKLLPSFYKKLEENYEEKGEDELTGSANCFIMGVPGSFYCRLFPRNNLHFVHSSYSLHWLSQAPENIQNPGNIYISKIGPSTVFEAYLKQFQNDFSTFLRCRSMEMVAGGRMILTFKCRNGEDPTCGDCYTVWNLLTKSLLDLVSEGLIEQKDVDSFNVPFYAPYKDEVKATIEKEKSFNLETLEAFELHPDPKEDEDVHKSGKNIASAIRPITEPTLASHFGDLFDLYEKFAEHLEKVILKVQPILDETLEKVYIQLQGEDCLRIADLGCSSGPNTFSIISQIVETLQALSNRSQYCKPSELQIYLNDLPENDFNSIFKFLPSFYKKLEEDYEEKEEDESTGPANCFIMGVPGSFYCRLFPSNNLHFVHSSYSLHWLSQVPENMQNPRNIYISKIGPSPVFEAYLKQFQNDFSTFLRCRSKEMIGGGCMILTFICRSGEDPTCGDSCTVWDLLTKSLLDLVSEGLIQEKDVDSFNIPYYAPYKDEVKAVIEKEESFNLETLEVFERNSDTKDDEDVHRSGKNIASAIRAITEPTLASHFGDLFDLYEKFAEHLAEHLCHEKVTVTSLVISLSKK